MQEVLTFIYADINPAFKPDERQTNAIQALVLGIFEGPFSINSGLGYPDVDWAWIRDTIPNANVRMSELIAAGFVWQHRWSDGDFSLGLTEGGVAWAEAHLGMPKVDDREDPTLETWVRAQDIKTKRQHDHTGTSRIGQKMGISTISAWVRRERFTPSQARTAKASLDAAVATGRMTRGSAAAYRAHITRRTA
jgi:hypothetical protein